ncbi:MAG: hypothetical protein JW969_16550 [Spirochaetales bacterium]|nr:hypothetical protein [Spirochaetales bacterium]
MEQKEGRILQIMKRRKAMRNIMIGAALVVAGIAVAIITFSINIVSGSGFLLLLVSTVVAGSIVFYSGYSKIKSGSGEKQIALKTEDENPEE